MDFGFYILILGNVITLYKRYTFCSLDKVAQTSFLGLPTCGAPSVKVRRETLVTMDFLFIQVIS